MINRRGVRPDPRLVAVVVFLALAGTLQVGCTSCLSTPRPTPAERLEKALREEALRKAATHTSDPPVSTLPSPPPCPIFGSPSAPATPAAIGGHRVILSWRASAPADSSHAAAVGYCIYRGVKRKDPSPVLVNPTPFQGTSCADDMVVSDQQYYYVVRAISANGVTSIISNEALAAIPKQSLPSASGASPPLCRVPGYVK